jgi:predicted site-specific integrase-resolvase
MNIKDFVEKSISKIKPTDEKAIIIARDSAAQKMKDLELKIESAQSIVSRIKSDMLDVVESGQNVGDALKAKRSEKEARLNTLLSEKDGYRSLISRLDKMYEQAKEERELASILEILIQQNITTAEQLKKALNIN